MKLRVWTGTAAVAALAVAAIALTSPAGSANGRQTPPANTTTTTSTTSTTTTTTTTTTLVPTHNPDNPFTDRAMALYLKGRAGMITAAVYDVANGTTYTYHNGYHDRTASIVKIDILADLLYESQQSGTPLTAKEQSLATSMIEASDDADASKLWAQIGGRDAIDSFNALIGFKSTVPSWSWGDISTTPLDQLQLLKVIALPNAILDTASRDFEMGLMENVIGGQRFGLGWGSPAKAIVGVKDGWYDEIPTGWQVNSTGFVEFQGRFYLATIMTASDPNETYGMNSVTTIANDIWKYLKPRVVAPT
ncbi:MAG: serine hydrolase [Acidimicrobiales bacterium]